MFGQDNLKFKKKNEFVIYIGSHGDRGADISDVILPGATYTEQDGHFTNLEGILQKAYKATYPPGEAKEDWEIINNLSQLLKRKKLYYNKDQLVSDMINFINNNKKINSSNKTTNFYDEKIFTEYTDYYYSNVVSRSSKTMSDCRSIRNNIKKTGTEG